MATFAKKKYILVIFGKFKKRNPCAVGFFCRILDRNVVVAVTGRKIPKIVIMFPERRNTAGDSFNLKTFPKT